MNVQYLFIPSVIMGLGIAIDVAIATLSRFRDSSMKFSNWTLPVATSHIVLPAIGYYSWWMLGHFFGAFSLLLGLSGFVLVTLFVYEAICDWVDHLPIVSLAPVTKWIVDRFDKSFHSRFVMVIAVSMDALWSGPAKAAQADSAQWSGSEVFISFFIAGGVVLLVAESALILASLLRRISFSDKIRLAVYLVAGKYFEATILFSFGLLSLWNAFHSWFEMGSLSHCIFFSGLIMMVVWVIFLRRLINNQLLEIKLGESQ